MYTVVFNVENMDMVLYHINLMPVILVTYRVMFLIIVRMIPIIFIKGITVTSKYFLLY